MRPGFKASLRCAYLLSPPKKPFNQSGAATEWNFHKPLKDHTD